MLFFSYFYELFKKKKEEFVDYFLGILFGFGIFGDIWDWGEIGFFFSEFVISVGLTCLEEVSNIVKVCWLKKRGLSICCMFSIV